MWLTCSVESPLMSVWVAEKLTRLTGVLELWDSEDESEILEESPCGRWLKRREEVPPPFPFLSFSSDLLAREDNM